MFLENASQKGWIEVICGSMFSGKTEELIRRLRRAQFANLRVEIFKPCVDTRYSDEEVVSHDAHAIRSTPVESAQNILLLTSDVDVVGIDEAQFFDEVINDVSDKYPEKPLLTLWSEYRRHGSLPAGEAIRLRNHFAPYYKEFTADSHPADDAYLRDIESERPTPQAQARELWLKTENLWTAFPGFIAALKAL